MAIVIAVFHHAPHCFLILISFDIFDYATKSRNLVPVPLKPLRS